MYISGIMKDSWIFIVIALEIPQSCTKPPISISSDSIRRVYKVFCPVLPPHRSFGHWPTCILKYSEIRYTFEKQHRSFEPAFAFCLMIFFMDCKLTSSHNHETSKWFIRTQIAKFIGPTWVLSAPSGPHELCYQGSYAPCQKSLQPNWLKGFPNKIRLQTGSTILTSQWRNKIFPFTPS